MADSAAPAIGWNGVTSHSEPGYWVLDFFWSTTSVSGRRDEVSIGTEGDRVFFILPQGSGRARLYLMYARTTGDAMPGPGSAPAFLRQLRSRLRPR